jgi:hypothetical protein
MVDALSMQFGEDETFFSLSLPIEGWIEESHQEWMENDTIFEII